MQLDHFLATHPVFRLAEFRQACCVHLSEGTVQTKLKRLKQAGRLRQLAAGVYAVVPAGQNLGFFAPDRLLTASRLMPDSVLAYHSAFEALGFANQVFTQVTYLTAHSHRVRRRFFGSEFVALAPPTRLGSVWDQIGVDTGERSGLVVRLTGRERTLVDCLDRPSYSGGFEELLACATEIPSLDIDLVQSYLAARQSPTLYARLGFLLERFAEQWFVENAQLVELEAHLPKAPAYLLRREPGNVLIRRWNLLVPPYLLQTEESPLR